MSASVRCSELTKDYDGRHVLERIDWELPMGSLTGLIGPSGAGKTTLLRIIANLESATAGRIERPQSSSGKRAAASNCGMMFQDLGLWPHLTAREHLLCVLGELPRRARQLAAEKLLSECRLPAECWDQLPARLSGGERQRLALARALAPEPELLLLDEPFSQLDGQLTLEFLHLIRDQALQRQMTVVYVTHAWHEAAQICDRLAVLIDGRLHQSGTFEEVFWRPTTARVSRLTGPVAEIPLRFVDAGYVHWEPDAVRLVEGDQLIVRPHQLEFDGGIENEDWQVCSVRPLGTGWRAELRSNRRNNERLDCVIAGFLAIGSWVRIRVRSLPVGFLC